jgi:hypothetical protein
MKAKKLKVHCPAMKARGLKAPKTTLDVIYFEHTVGIPWADIRPLVASAFRHIQRAGFHDHGVNFLLRMLHTPQIILNKGQHGFWWGRCCGCVSRVYIGKLHTEAQKTTYPLFKDMPVFWHKDWKEHLVGLVAHELWHRWQPGHGKPAEIMCELVESDAIDTYRREQGYIFTPPIEPEVETTESKNENTHTPIGADTVDQRMHLQLSLQP